MVIEHQKQDLFLHLGNNRKVYHFVRGNDGVSGKNFLCLFGKKVIIDFWDVLKGRKEQILR